jgi:hypothetical protein
VWPAGGVLGTAQEFRGYRHFDRACILHPNEGQDLILHQWLLDGRAAAAAEMLCLRGAFGLQDINAGKEPDHKGVLGSRN